MKVTVVGMGLIGGSVARALNNKSFCVYGIDRDKNVIDFAVAHNIIKQCDNPIEQSDVVILCLYPEASLDFVKQNISKFKKDCIITDVVGIKTPLTDFFENGDYNLTYIGGHPMAGKEVSGFINSAETMFAGANFIITPTKGATEAQIGVVRSIAEAIGCATITITTAQNHDKIIAYTSQLPHVIATAMCDTPQLVKHKNFTGGSFEDVTRVAKINENLWCELFLGNKDNIIEEINRFSESLDKIKSAIISNDKQSLTDIMRNVRLVKEKIDNERY